MKLQVAAPDFSLAHTLECGQAFRWQARPGGGYYGFLGACAVKATQDQALLTVETVDPRLTEQHIQAYFALDVDLAPILSSIDVDAQIHEAIGRFPGLRILRQDPWETLASFICSSFNNIKRIEGLIERLAQAYGLPASFNGFRGCAFPRPEALAKVPERRLRELGLGFRAGYLRATARRVAEGKLSLEMLKRCDYPTTKAALMRCDGVGEKVADCVALFGLQKYDAFPIDVWMERVMRYYFRKAKMTPVRMHEFAQRHFGRYAGYAQQYLYHYVRTARAPTAMRAQETTKGYAPLS